MPKRTKQHCAELRVQRVRHIDLIHPVKIFGSTTNHNKCKAETKQPKQRVKQQETAKQPRKPVPDRGAQRLPFLAFPFLESCVRHIDLIWLNSANEKLQERIY